MTIEQKSKDTIAALPEKGQKRIEAIAALGADIINAEALMTLAKTEKGKCKTTALKTLALFDYKPAADLWEKCAMGKYMSEEILMPSCSDSVSEQIAPVITNCLSTLFALPAGAELNSEQLEKLRFCISIMLGKASESMLEVYRFAAENAEWLRGFEKKNHLLLNSGNIQFWNATSNELEKIFPAILTASIVKSKDRRLMDLADELYAKYGGCWLIPVFMKSVLTNGKEKTYDDFSKYLSGGESAIYLYNVLGMLYYEDFPKGFERKDRKKGFYALIFWGNYAYGNYDTKCSFSQPVELDERWLYRLAENPKDAKPKVTLQTYNRRMGGVKYEDYDEMLLELLPLEMEAGELKKVLSAYFLIRSKIDDGETSLYRDAKERFLK